MATTIDTSPFDSAPIDRIVEERALQATIARRTWRMTLRNALIITQREVRDSFRDWRIMGPIFTLTLIFPLLAQGMTEAITNFFEENGATASQVEVLLPLLPLIVGFFPISISLVIALETFVGEKERRSLEPLLSTPLTNIELYLGKALAAMIPPLLASYLGIGVYVTGLIASGQWTPPAVVIVQILLLTTAQALVMVTGAVVVSSQTTSTRASNLLASFIILPTSFLVLFESLVIVNNRLDALWWVLVGLVVTVMILLRMGVQLFNREELLGRAIDNINLQWLWGLFRKQFTKGAKNLVAWYRQSVFPTLREMRPAMLVVVIAIVGMFIGGIVIARVQTQWQIPAGYATERSELVKNFEQTINLGNGVLSVGGIFMQNLRVLSVASFLAIFTLGVMSIFFGSVTFGALGFLLGQPIVATLGAGTIAAALIPHSLAELPAIIIAAGAATRLGAIFTAPPKGQGVMEAWVRAFADLIKVWIALVIPLLLIGAVLETVLTPRLVLAVLGG